MNDLARLKIDRSGMVRRPKRVPGGVGFWFGMAVLGLGAVVFWPKISGWIDRVRLPAVKVLRVVASSPAAVSAVRGTAANGYVVAVRRAALSADTPGRIVEINVTEGSVVEKGDVVARLYADEYAAALLLAETEIHVSEASVMRAKAEGLTFTAEKARSEKAHEASVAGVDVANAAFVLAQKELDRAGRSYEGGIGTDQDLDRTKKELDEADARLRSAKADEEEAALAVEAAVRRVAVGQASVAVATARVAASRAVRDQAKATLEKTEVRAPFDGVVVLKDAEVGEVVSPNSQGGSSARGSLCTMVDFDSLEVQADVPETSLSAVASGAPAQIFLDAFPGRPYSGLVSRIWPTANRQKGTVEVRVTFDHPDERLRPEMGVRVVFGATDGSTDGSTDEDGTTLERDVVSQILIPAEAVVRTREGDGVFVLERDRVHYRLVRCGREKSGRVVIENGLSEGERIVVEPSPSLKSEDRVRIQEN